ncbi:MAG: hypothetical protein ACF8TS_12905, partial [Maioricimonas sp. JB049]
MLQITYDESASGGSEITLQLNDAELTADAYFFALDRGCEPDSRSHAKVRAVLAVLLDQWHERLASADDGAVVDLPFEFADEFIGCLRCRIDGDDVDVAAGWLMTAGSAVVPSTATANLPAADWEPRDDVPVVAVPRAELLKEI